MDVIISLGIIVNLYMMFLIISNISDLIKHIETFNKLMKNISFQIKSMATKKTLDVNEISVSGNITAESIKITPETEKSNSLPTSNNDENNYEQSNDQQIESLNNDSLNVKCDELTVQTIASLQFPRKSGSIKKKLLSMLKKQK